MLRCVRVRMHVAPRAARLASPLGAPDLYIPIAMNLTCGSQCSLCQAHHMSVEIANWWYALQYLHLTTHWGTAQWTRRHQRTY